MKVVFRTKNIIVKNTVILWPEEECCDIKIYARAPHGNSENVKDMDRMEGRYLTLYLSLVWSAVLFVIILI